MKSKAHFIDGLFESLIFFLDQMILVFPLKNIFFLKKEKFKNKVEINGIFIE